MQAEFKQKEQIGIVALTGELNAVSVDELRNQFKSWFQANPGLQNVVMDLADVTMIDSAGLGVLIALLKLVGERGGDLRLAGLQKRVRLVFEITRTHRIFEIFDTAEEAVAAA